MQRTFILLLLSLAFLASSKLAHGQVYRTAIGARLGYPVSASIKHFISEESALEAYAGIRPYYRYFGVNASLAYLYHQPIDAVDNLQWYVGGGGSVFFYNYSYLNDFASIGFGVNGYLGLDYVIDDYPINLTVDWVPSIFLGGNSPLSTFGFGYGALGIRYIIGD
jgi:hypothetical protein